MELFVQSDFPIYFGKLTCHEDDTLGKVKNLAKKTCGISEDDQTYQFFISQFLQDIIELQPSGEDSKSSFQSHDDVSLKELKITPFSTLYLVAPAHLKPAPKILKTGVTSGGGGGGGGLGVSTSDGKGGGEEKKIEINLSIDEIWKAIEKEKESKKKEAIISYACKNGKKLFESKTLETEATKESIKLVLKENTLCVPEIVLFESVIRWAKRKASSEKAEELKTYLSDILPLIRFPTMTTTELASKVVPSGILDVPVTLELFAYIGAKDSKTPIPLGTNTKHFNATPRRGGGFTWKSKSKELVISEDLLTVSQTAKAGSCYGSIGFISGKHSWTIEILACRGNCLDIGVWSPTGHATRVSGLHANGSSVRLQGAGEKSEGGSKRWKKFSSGMKVTVHLDMDAKNLSFTVDGVATGVVLNSLPKLVHPGIDFRERNLSIKLLPDMEIDWSGVDQSTLSTE